MTGKYITTAIILIELAVVIVAILFMLGTILDIIPVDPKIIQVVVVGIFGLIVAGHHERSE